MLVYLSHIHTQADTRTRSHPHCIKTYASNHRLAGLCERMCACTCSAVLMGLHLSFSHRGWSLPQSESLTTLLVTFCSELESWQDNFPQKLFCSLYGAKDQNYWFAWKHDHTSHGELNTFGKMLFTLSVLIIITVLKVARSSKMNKIYNDYKESKLEPRHHLRVYPTARGKAILLFLLSLLTASSFSQSLSTLTYPLPLICYTQRHSSLFVRRDEISQVTPRVLLILCPKPVIFM